MMNNQKNSRIVMTGSNIDPSVKGYYKTYKTAWLYAPDVNTLESVYFFQTEEPTWAGVVDFGNIGVLPTLDFFDSYFKINAHTKKEEYAVLYNVSSPTSEPKNVLTKAQVLNTQDAAFLFEKTFKGLYPIPSTITFKKLKELRVKSLIIYNENRSAIISWEDNDKDILGWSYLETSSLALACSLNRKPSAKLLDTSILQRNIIEKIKNSYSQKFVQDSLDEFNWQVETALKHALIEEIPLSL